MSKAEQVPSFPAGCRQLMIRAAGIRQMEENVKEGIMKYPENRKRNNNITVETATGPAGSIVELLFYGSLFLIGLCTMFLFFRFTEIDSSTLNMPFIGHLFAILNIGFLMIMILSMAELVRNRIRDRKDTR